MMANLSLRSRLLIVHVGAILLIVACAASAGWWQLSRSVNDQLDAALLALAETEVGMLAGASSAPIRVHDTPAGSAPSLTRLDRLVQIVDLRGGVLARSDNLGTGFLPMPKSLRARLEAGLTVFETLPNVGDEPLRMVSLPVTVNGRTMAVQVAGSLDDVNQTLQSAELLFAAMATALVLGVGGAGLLLTRGILHAIDTVVDEASRISDANLHARLPHSGTDDEIGHLVDTLNAMLARLEAAFDGQRRFTADASHELRSPLSRLRMEIEVTLRRPRRPQEYIDTLRSCMDEVERLTTLVEQLLALARIDADADGAAELEAPLDAIAMAQAIVARLAPRAYEKHAVVQLDTTAVNGAIVPARAAVVLANLLDNALKFSPPGGTVALTLASTSTGLMLQVRDNGPGIAPEDLPYIFDRFYRSKRARAETAGVGVGLALSRAIVHSLHGSITANNTSGGGTEMTAQFPITAYRPADTLNPNVRGS